MPPTFTKELVASAMNGSFSNNIYDDLRVAFVKSVNITIHFKFNLHQYSCTCNILLYVNCIKLYQNYLTVFDSLQRSTKSLAWST